MRFFNYAEINTLPKGNHFIVLLTKIDGKYYGIKGNNSYPIKYSGKLNHEFLVCTKIIGLNEEYLLPIGYSNEDEWINQEHQECLKIITK